MRKWRLKKQVIYVKSRMELRFKPQCTARLKLLMSRKPSYYFLWARVGGSCRPGSWRAENSTGISLRESGLPGNQHTMVPLFSEPST